MPGDNEADKKFTRCVDGSVKYSKDQKDMINGKSEGVDQRVDQKLGFEDKTK